MFCLAINPPRYGQKLEWRVPESPFKHEVSASLQESTDDEYKVVCYFTNWAWYRQGKGKFLPEDIDADLCSHIIYGFAVLDGSSHTIKTHDSWADVDNSEYIKFIQKLEHRVKTIETRRKF